MSEREMIQFFSFTRERFNNIRKEYEKMMINCGDIVDNINSHDYKIAIMEFSNIAAQNLKDTEQVIKMLDIAKKACIANHYLPEQDGDENV